MSEENKKRCFVCHVSMNGFNKHHISMPLCIYPKNSENKSIYTDKPSLFSPNAEFDGMYCPYPVLPKMSDNKNDDNQSYKLNDWDIDIISTYICLGCCSDGKIPNQNWLGKKYCYRNVISWSKQPNYNKMVYLDYNDNAYRITDPLIFFAGGIDTNSFEKKLSEQLDKIVGSKLYVTRYVDYNENKYLQELPLVLCSLVPKIIISCERLLLANFNKERI